MKDIVELIKLFGSIHKILLVIFVVGLGLIYLPESIKEQFYLKSFIQTYGIWIGIAIFLSGGILAVEIVVKSFNWLVRLIAINKDKKMVVENLKNLSIDEKKVLTHSLANRTRTSDLGLYIDIPPPVEQLMAKGYLHRHYIHLSAYFSLDEALWYLLQNHWEEIFYEDIFKAMHA
jgi:hypothetical protein